MISPISAFDCDRRVREEIRRSGPREAFRRLIAENDALIREPVLGNGRAITSARTAIYTNLMADWAAEQQAAGYRRPFAVVALGGAGRGEMTPCSDTDFVFLFDDVIDGNSFLLELQRQVLNSDEFHERCGFSCAPLPFNLDDIPALEGKQLNAFLDLRKVYDPHGLTERFRERIRATFDPFEHFLHVHRFWRRQWEKSAGECERLDRFDIKNDGLRVFLAGIWILAGKAFLHSHSVYRTLDDPRDLEAYDFLLRLRTMLHGRRAAHSRATATGDHAEDLLEFDDIASFGEWLGPAATEKERFDFANEVRARLLSARRRVAWFTNGVIGRELERGRELHPGSAIVLGVDGLRSTASGASATPVERSRAALSLLVAAQHYEVPLARSELEATFHHAGDWLAPVPELSALFYESRGSLADSFAILSQVDGAMDRLFPGYAKFETSLDGRVLAERRSLRGVLEREKMRALEQLLRDGRAALSAPVSTADPDDPTRSVSIAIETALLDEDHLAAVKLALKTKRLPLTADDLALRQDVMRPLHERLATGVSDIPLEEYYACLAGCEFTPETLRVTRFLVANRRVFKERAAAGLNDARQVGELVRLCQTEAALRALFVFTCADRAVWESEVDDPTRWFNTRELYAKARMQFRPGIDPTRVVTAAGYSADELEILMDFGEDFFSGVYRQYANRFGGHLVRLAQDAAWSCSKASILREGASTILGVAARDYRGVAASISGAFWKQGIALAQAHLFSAEHHGLALDFFHLAPGETAPDAKLARSIEEAIQGRLYIGADDEAGLPRIAERVTLEEWRPDLHCLRAESSGDVGALIYALTYKVFRHLGGDVFGLTAHTGRSGAWVSVYYRMPVDRSLKETRALLSEKF
ncbi:MAG TPA: DUF294 nucleotidyltransferase-like domain-containing protein [Chthoniobacteraceae bacterium]|jgi:hypothetical protein|nr:DUF294 nucleotidyltransferase-like domain-containing protein [Chthoniobacteraceae bacterium]